MPIHTQRFHLLPAIEAIALRIRDLEHEIDLLAQRLACRRVLRDRAVDCSPEQVAALRHGANRGMGWLSKPGDCTPHVLLRKDQALWLRLMEEFEDAKDRLLKREVGKADALRRAKEVWAHFTHVLEPQLDVPVKDLNDPAGNFETALMDYALGLKMGFRSGGSQFPAKMAEIEQRAMRPGSYICDKLLESDALRQFLEEAGVPMLEIAENSAGHGGVAVDEAGGVDGKVLAAPDSQPEMTYRFHLKGKTIETTFEGVSCSFRSAEGFPLVRALMLLRCSGDRSPVHYMDVEALAAGLSVRSTSEDTVVDWAAIASSNDRVAALKKEQADTTDPDRIKAIDGEILDITEEVRRARGLRGRPRPMKSERDRTRKRVARNISLAIEAIGEKDAALSKHLDDRIRSINGEWAYRIDSPPDWDLFPKRTP